MRVEMDGAGARHESMDCSSAPSGAAANGVSGDANAPQRKKPKHNDLGKQFQSQQISKFNNETSAKDCRNLLKRLLAFVTFLALYDNGEDDDDEFVVDDDEADCGDDEAVDHEAGPGGGGDDGSPSNSAYARPPKRLRTLLKEAWDEFPPELNDKTWTEWAMGPSGRKMKRVLTDPDFDIKGRIKIFFDFLTTSDKKILDMMAQAGFKRRGDAILPSTTQAYITKLNKIFNQQPFNLGDKNNPVGPNFDKYALKQKKDLHRLGIYLNPKKATWFPKSFYDELFFVAVDAAGLPDEKFADRFKCQATVVDRVLILNGCLMALMAFVMGRRAKDMLRLTWSCIQDTTVTTGLDMPSLVVHNNGTKNHIETAVKYGSVFDMLTHTCGGPLCCRGGDVSKDRSAAYITNDSKRFNYDMYMALREVEWIGDANTGANVGERYMCIPCILILYIKFIGDDRPSGDTLLFAGLRAKESRLVFQQGKISAKVFEASTRAAIEHVPSVPNTYKANTFTRHSPKVSACIHASRVLHLDHTSQGEITNDSTLAMQWRYAMDRQGNRENVFMLMQLPPPIKPEPVALTLFRINGKVFSIDRKMEVMVSQNDALLEENKKLRTRCLALETALTKSESRMDTMQATLLAAISTLEARLVASSVKNHAVTRQVLLESSFDVALAPAPPPLADDDQAPPYCPVIQSPDAPVKPADNPERKKYHHTCPFPSCKKLCGEGKNGEHKCFYDEEGNPPRRKCSAIRSHVSRARWNKGKVISMGGVNKKIEEGDWKKSGGGGGEK